MSLATIRTRILTLMGDTGTTFPDTTLDEAIRTTLGLINTVTSCAKIDTITLTANSREFSIAALGQATITEVWLPYTAANPEDPPNIRAAFVVFPGPILRITDGNTPTAGDVARIFYTAPHTIQDLDDALTTTLTNPAPLIAGSAAYALLVRLRKISETVRTNPKAATELTDLQTHYARTFEAWLESQRTRPTGTFLEW